MNVLQLRGLSGSNPLGAMAAFGLLRILSIEERFIQDFGQAKLAWSFASDWIPELHLERSCELEQLITVLIDRQTERCSLLFREGWCDDIKCAPGVFRELWQSVLRQYETGSDVSSASELAAFLAAYGSEVIKDKKAKPDVKPTGFHMTAGQQRFLKSAKVVAESLDPNQLASKRQTTEARKRELGEAYRVALIGLETLRIMLGYSEFDDAAKNVSIWQARGVCAVMRSQCVRDANGRGTFRNSTEHVIF